MPYLPPGQSVHITAGLASNILKGCFDNGASLPNRGPHSQQLNQWGCTIVRDFEQASTRTRLKTGMQGHIVQEAYNENSGHGVKIYIEGVTEHWSKNEKTGINDWIKHIWVPADVVKKGAPWRRELTDWPITLDLGIGSHTSQAWGQVRSSDFSTLGRTITTLLKAFQTSPPNFAQAKLEQLFTTRSVDSISQIIVQGFKDSGLYTVLNQPSFTVQDILSSATHVIDNDYTRDRSGIYIRHHESNDSVTFWKAKTRYLYVGKTINFHERYVGHQYTTSKYGDLTRNSRRLNMVAICVLNRTDTEELAFLVEQIAICLFQSYRTAVMPGASATVSTNMDADNGGSLLASRVHAKYFVDVSRLVFPQTGWPGGVARTSFGVPYGANFTSPLAEWCAFGENMLWILTKTALKDRITGSSVPVAIFRSAASRFASHRSQLKSYGKRNITVWAKTHKNKQFFSLNINSDGQDGSKAPLADVPYQIFIEVREDGSPHPHAWANLREIGPFENWDQARSFAFGIEFEHPLGSGQYIRRYIQAKRRQFRFADDNVPGSHQNYAMAISFLQWLYNAKPNHNHSWITKLFGSAHVLQANYDLHNQAIAFTPPKERLIMVSGRLRNQNNVVRQMKQVRLGLENVGGHFGRFSGDSARAATRTACDICCMLPDKAYEKTILTRGCQQVGNSRVCRNCQKLGFPCCSWTNKRSIGSAVKFSEENQKGANKIVLGISPEMIREFKVVYPALVGPLRSESTEQDQNLTRRFVTLDGSTSNEEDPADMRPPEEEERHSGDESD